MLIEKILIEYKRLKNQLVGEPGYELSIDEVCWNDGIIEAMENLLKEVPKDIVKMVRLGHI